MQNDMRDRLIKDCENLMCFCQSINCYKCEHKDIPYPRCMGVHLADHLISNDVVPVVRCKDCKKCDHFYPRCSKDGNLEEAYSCMVFDYIVQPNHFCGYGERKSANE